MWKNINPSRYLSFLIILLAIGLSNSIFIPLAGRAPRCMIVYSVGESETVKLDINFPPLNMQTENEAYVLSWKNTETNQTTA